MRPTRSPTFWVAWRPSSAGSKRPDAHFARAAEFTARAGAKFLAANTNLFWAEMLIERDAPGDAEQARHLLAAANEIALANGYAYIARRATEALEHLE